MEKREKVEYILEQMRLCLAKRDFVRMQIISKKISVKFFDDDKEQVRFSFAHHLKELSYIVFVDYKSNSASTEIWHGPW